MDKDDAPTIALIGNYALDRQESMLRFRDLLSEQLAARGFRQTTISPGAVVGRLAGAKGNKWLAYVDKFLFFPALLWVRLGLMRFARGRGKVVVHICDHSNSVYAKVARFWAPVVVTCHDLLAVRGALGEDTDCPASGLGKLLQVAILRGLADASEVVCVSQYTRADLIRLAGAQMETRSQVVPLAMNYPYRMLAREGAMAQWRRAGLALEWNGYILHVGSGLRRKNREALLRAAAGVGTLWNGKIVFAGAPLGAEQRELAESLGLRQRVVEVNRPDNELLMALYNGALALVFMSRFEGFGWPVLEAQASGCPVICSNRASVPEVAGEGALVCDAEDHAAVGRGMLQLMEADLRRVMIDRGLENAGRFTIARMMESYENVYLKLVAHA